ncbi:hypothetical protein CLV63_10370 [Murinocardiopsis flavida]|uniref:Uncharacterized protein n=1 Tax=Murinocardiopsis flavida TaxID=645275 RepID=A0A2P8DQ85_9ACTN|nr:hypothetical protein [Murinocardiopsis flavida]PSK99348.1 hypothetical protein CLV63_10370 [Murinocardiopsis flavida]
MTQWWRSKPLGALTASEIVAVLERLAQDAPDDAALEMALRRELTRAAHEEWMFDDDSGAGTGGTASLVA